MSPLILLAFQLLSSFLKVKYEENAILKVYMLHLLAPIPKSMCYEA